MLLGGNVRLEINTHELRDCQIQQHKSQLELKYLTGPTGTTNEDMDICVMVVGTASLSFICGTADENWKTV